MICSTIACGACSYKNLTLNMGNCNHRRYVPELIELVRSRRLAPEEVLTQVKPLVAAIDAYKAFDKREAGWTKVELKPRPTIDDDASAHAHVCTELCDTTF